MQCHRHSLAAGRGNNLYLASGKVCVFKVFLSVNFDLQTTIWWSCFGGEGEAAVSPLSNALWNLGLFENVLDVKTSVCGLGGIMQHLSAQESLGMSAHRASLPFPILSLSVTNLFNPQMLFSCAPWGAVRVPLWNSSVFWWWRLLIEAGIWPWNAPSLITSGNQHSGGNPCRALLYLYVDEPGGKFPEMLDVLLDLPEGSAWLLCSKALSTPSSLTFWETATPTLSGNHFLFTGTLLNLSRSFSLFILLKYMVWQHENHQSWCNVSTICYFITAKFCTLV